MRSRLFMVLVAVLLLPCASSAQLSVEAIEASGGLSAFLGDDFDGLEAGPRFQLSLFLPATPLLSLGVTGTYGRIGAEGEDATVTEWGLGATARRNLASTGLYVGAYLGWARLAVDLSPTVQTDGVMVGPVAGFDIPVGPFDLFLGGEFLFASMGSFRFSMGGPGLGGGGDKGWRYGGEAGIRLTP